MIRCRHCRHLRRQLALEMRENGKTFIEIGAALGITTAAAHKIYRTALKARAKVRAAAAADARLSMM